MKEDIVDLLKIYASLMLALLICIKRYEIPETVALVIGAVITGIGVLYFMFLLYEYFIENK